MPNNYKKRCPDGAVCNHDCESRCFRVDNCEPLSGVYPEDEWPSEMSAEEVQPTPVDDSAEICVVCELPIEDGHMRGMGDGSGDQFAHEVCYWRAQAEKWEAAYHDVKTIGCYASELQDRSAMQDNLAHLQAKLKEVGISRRDRRTEARVALEASVRGALEENLELRQAKIVELEKERDVLVKAARMGHGIHESVQRKLESQVQDLVKVNQDLDDALDAVRSLEAECLSLAARVCPMDGGLVLGEDGTVYCTRKRVDENNTIMRDANKKLGSALEEVSSQKRVLEQKNRDLETDIRYYKSGYYKAKILNR